jgi:hypothetical protein
MDLFSLLSDVIDNLELPLCDLSLVVRYLKSCVTLMIDVDDEQVPPLLALDLILLLLLLTSATQSLLMV